MKILVVGGAGYIGSHCVRQLLAAGHEPLILDNFVYGHRDSIPQGLTVYEGDMGDISFTQPILEKEKVDIVMHFAAFAYVGESTTDPLKYYDNNIAKTVHLLQAMRNTKVNTFIFSSSCTIFGDTNEMPLHEDLPRQAFSPYGQTKQDVEVLLGYCAKAYGLSYACFRYFNASGADPDGKIGEDHDPDRRIGGRCDQCLVNRRGYLPAQRVACRGAVDGHERHSAVAFRQDGWISGHCITLNASMRDRAASPKA